MFDACLLGRSNVLFARRTGLLIACDRRGAGEPVLGVAVRSADRSLLNRRVACHGDVQIGDNCSTGVLTSIRSGFVCSWWPSHYSE